jgi:hypothetical protein
VLEEGWDVGGEEELDQDIADERAPFGLDFPGLTAAEHTRLPAAAPRAAVTAERSSFLALVCATHPADVPAAVGWSVFGVDDPGTPMARSRLSHGFGREGSKRWGHAGGADPAGPGQARHQ